MFKRSVLLINMALVLVLLLGACAPAATPTAAPQAEATKAPAADTAAAPAPTKALEPVTLTWYLDGTEPKDLKEVQDAFNALPQVKALNVTVNFIFYDWGAFDQKMQLLFSGGEPCDLVFTASWANNYVNNAVNGTLIPLDDLLPKVTPKLWSMVPQNAWLMSQVNGKIYAIPNQQLWYQAWGLILDKQIADKYNIDITKIKKMEDLNPYLAAVYKGEPQLAKKLIGEVGTEADSLYWGWDPVNGKGVIKRGDTSRKVINWIETPEYRKSVELFRQWYQAGYTPDAPFAIADMDTARKQGLYPFKFHVAKPGVNAEEKAMTGRDMVSTPMEEAVLSYVTPTMTGICTTSKNPERSLQLFELMYTDEVVYNTFAKGIEGKHWVWVDKEKKVIGFPEGVTAENSGWNINRDWMYGNQFLAYYVNPDQVGAWDETAKINSTASLPMAGPFVFDPTPVQAELTALDAVDKQYGNTLMWGLVDPNDKDTGIDAYIAAQKKAGIDKVIAEVQKQLDAFIAKNPDLFK